MNTYRIIHPEDNVAVTLSDMEQGFCLDIGGKRLIMPGNIPAGHKFALCEILKGSEVVKYGHPIGRASSLINRGEWIHSHNLRTDLEGRKDYTCVPFQSDPVTRTETFFSGYRRPDGSVGVRNELWIIPTTGCVNGIARTLENRAAGLVGGTIDAVAAFPHPYGCSQTGDDQENTRRILASLARHPNAGGVLVLGLGCENTGIEILKDYLGRYDKNRIRFLRTRDIMDEIESGMAILKELSHYAGSFTREKIPVSELIVGLKCGGSDGFSGITANPLVGKVSDRIIASGGTTILTEVPEMFGAETILMQRCVDRRVFEKTVSLINGFKDYYARHGQPVFENPSPGNIEGGITTLEEKSLGCVQKSGSTAVMDILAYGEAVTARGLNLLDAPGNDLVSTTALAASGAHLVLFTTGRGTPFGSSVPTVKIASNTVLFTDKPAWNDFNAGVLLAGQTAESAENDLFRLVLEVASGRRVAAELHGCREMAIFRQGVTL